MIIIKDKIFFFHIPKTGGLSVEKFLCECSGLSLSNPLNLSLGYFDIPFPLDNSQNKRGKITSSIQHTPYSIQKNWIKSNLIAFNNQWTKFTIVRNPYYRAFSAIYYQPPCLLTYNAHMVGDDLAQKRKLFKTSYRRFFETNDSLNGAWGGMRIPQYNLIEDVGLEELDIYKYEEGLDSILPKVLSHKYKLPPKIPYRHNATVELRHPKLNKEEYFDREYIERINDYYADDFKYLGYEMLNPLDYPE